MILTKVSKICQNASSLKTALHHFIHFSFNFGGDFRVTSKGAEYFRCIMFIFGPHVTVLRVQSWLCAQGPIYGARD